MGRTGRCLGDDGSREGNEERDKERERPQEGLRLPGGQYYKRTGDGNRHARLLRRIEETGRVPDIVYIAVSANDGAIDWCRDESPVPLHDDTQQVCAQRYQELTRRSLAIALRWAIETIRRRCPEAEIYAVSPLQAYSPEHEPGAFSGQAVKMIAGFKKNNKFVENSQ